MRWLPLVFLMAAQCAAAQPAPRERSVLIVTAEDSAPYQEAIQGIALALPGRPLARALHVDRDAGQIAAAAPGSIVIALGTRAAEGLAKIPAALVSCMVLRSRSASTWPRRYSVVLDHPVELQLEWIKRVLPAARRLLVIYNPEENQWRVEAALRAFARAGLTLVLRPASDPALLPGILEHSGDAADAIWGFPDAQLLNRNTARPLLLFSYRNRMPLIAPSDNWVAAGALFALSWNFQDLGRQCGEVAALLLQGRLPPENIIVPRSVAYTLNRRAIEHFRTPLAESLIKGARRVNE